MIELKNIKKTYKSKKGLPTEALKDINLTLGETGITFILGKSGSGKSTLLNILAGLDTYDSGEMIVDGKSTKDFKERDWDSYRNTYMGFVFQEYNLLDNYSVEENIKLSLELQHKNVTSDEVLDMLKLVDLEDILKRRTNELSGGQKQRVAIARALIKNPNVLLCDEPTGNLDSETSKQIFELLKKLSGEKLVVIVSHDEEAAKKYADCIIKIEDGVIKADKEDNHYFNNDKGFELISAKLPFSYSLKMGIGNLFKKKIKLAFTVLSLILCFICFGVTISIKNSDLTKEFIERFEKNGPREVVIQKYSRVISYKKVVSDLLSGTYQNMVMDDIIPTTVSFDESFIKEIKNKTKLDWNGIYFINLDGYASYGETNADNPLYYYMSDVNFSLNDALDNNKNLMGNVSEDGIVITSFIADYILYCGISAKDNIVDYSEEYLYKPTSYEQIISDDVYIKINNLDYFKVTGILKLDLSKYDVLKTLNHNQFVDLQNNDTNKYADYNDLLLELSNDFEPKRIYISQKKLEEYKHGIKNMTSSEVSEMVNYNGEYLYLFESSTRYGFLLDDSEVNNGQEIVKMNDLNDGELVINTKFLDVLLEKDYSIRLDEYLKAHSDANEMDYLNMYLKNKDIIGKKLSTNIVDNKVYLDTVNNIKEYKIVGIIVDNEKDGAIYFPKKQVDRLVGDIVLLKGAYRFVENTTELKEILKYYPLDESDALLYCTYAGYIEDSVLSSFILQLVGKVGMIAFGIIALLFLTNFISNSVRFRKKEIGIFRALGCKSSDVFTIFLVECIVLLLVCLVISSLIIPSICNLINDSLRVLISLQFKPAIFDINCILVMSAVGLLITLFVSFLTMLKVVKQKPIDTILDK